MVTSKEYSDKAVSIGIQAVILNEVLKNKTIRMIYQLIENGNIKSIKEIENKTKLSYKTVFLHIKELERLGLVVKEKQMNQQNMPVELSIPVYDTTFKKLVKEIIKLNSKKPQKEKNK